MAVGQYVGPKHGGTTPFWGRLGGGAPSSVLVSTLNAQSCALPCLKPGNQRQLTGVRA
jgi:hypothetical protein